MSKHTPGPWTVAADPDSENDVYYAVFAEDGISDARFEDDFIAVTNLNHANNEANARLIAAAPDLLAVLKAFSDYVHQEQSATDGAVTYSTTVINHWDFLARAAIAKATGGQA